MSLTAGVPPQRRDGARPERRDASVLQRRVGLTCVVGACLFVFWQMRPDLLFANSTPAGGDMAAHVWGPAFMRDHLLPAGRLTGWSPDWYAGFPAYQFYMVVPSLAIALASFVMPYGVAFKLVSVAGLVTLPLAAAIFVRLAGMRFPAPTLAALFTLPFLFDTSFTIFGGNVASTLAGEFAYSISLSLMLVYLGVMLRGLRTGRHRVLAGALLALVGLTHLIPAIFAVGATGVAFAMRAGRRGVRWLTVAGVLGATLAAFWLLPFWWWRDYYHNIDWVNLSEYWPNLVRDDWSWALVLAWAGLLVGILRRQRPALYLAALAALAAGGYRWMPQGVLWNARLLPFYYLSMLLLAAVGVAILLRTLVAGGPLRDASDQPGAGAEPADSPGLLRRFLPAGSLRLRIAIAAVVPTGAVAVAIDDLVAGRAALRALLEVLPGLGRATAPQRAAEVAHLALLILLAAAVVVLVELVRSLRAQGFRPRERGVVVLGAPPPGGAVPHQPAEAGGSGPIGAGTARPAGVMRPLGQGEPKSGGGRILTLATAVVALILVAVVAYPLRALGVAGHEVSDGRYGFRVAPNVVLAGTTQESFLPFWAYWNFSGYEAKQPKQTEASRQDPDGPAEYYGGYEEYYRVVTTMAVVAGDRGCGRVMWEYGLDRLDSYGSPMSLMLLPHWTDGCLGSMEGLFFESTQTVPFHFINQDELSAAPSRPVRAVPYGGTDLAAGVAHMQLFGVRYYMAFSESLVAEARTHPELTEVAIQPPWVIFEVAGAPLVAPLAAEPVVVTGAGNNPESWLDVAVPFYTGYVGSGALDPGAGPLSSAAVFPAADGPPDWARVPVGAERPVQALGPTEVYGVSATDNSISFRVSEVGVPVLVKTSYFPNWRVEDGRGPYRVAPNLMVVVPASTEVTLTYRWSAVEVLAWVITAIGLILALVLLRNPHIWTAEPSRRPPWQ